MISFLDIFGKLNNTTKVSAENYKALFSFIEDEFDKRIDKLMKEFEEGNRDDVQSAFKRAMKAYDAKRTLQNGSFSSKPIYLADYTLLHKAYELLTRDEKEGFCVVTGPDINDNIFALARIIEPNMKVRSATGAKPDFGKMADLLGEMEEKQGSRLISYFHSHPGNGMGATKPSGTDHDTQDGYERGGYPSVGAIFSRDGYVRFYSHNRDFQVEVSGKGGEQVEEKIFRLDRDSEQEIENARLETG